MKFYTYYRKEIKRWRTETPVDGGLKHLSYGKTKEECEKKALKKVRVYIDLDKLMKDWR